MNVKGGKWEEDRVTEGKNKIKVHFTNVWKCH
jgi:hypothetical protein